MVTITVSMPEDMEQRMSLIETMTKEKGYKLIETNLNNKTMLFEIAGLTKQDANANKPQILLD